MRASKAPRGSPAIVATFEKIDDRKTPAYCNTAIREFVEATES